MRLTIALGILSAALTAQAQEQSFHQLNLNATFVCEQLKARTDDPVLAVLRSQFSGIRLELHHVDRIRNAVAPRLCTHQTLEDAINTVLGVELAKRDFKGVEIKEPDSARRVVVDAAETLAEIPAPVDLPEGQAAADRLARDLTRKVEKLGAGVNAQLEGLSADIRDLKQLNLPKRPMQLGSEIVYTYAGTVGRRWTPSMRVQIDGKVCGKERKKAEQARAEELVSRSCRVLELKEIGQFSCWKWDDLRIFFRTCYELTIEEEALRATDKKPVVRRFDVERARDDLPSQVYLPMLVDAEKHSGTTPVVGETTYERIVRIQRSRNEKDYERTRAHIGALAAVNEVGSDSLLTAAALHLYLSEQPWLPGRLDLIRRTSVIVLYGNLDLGAASTKTLGVGASIDIVRGFALTLGYSRYTLDTSLDPAIPVGTEVHTGSGFVGLSINTEVVNNNKSLAGFFGQ